MASISSSVSPQAYRDGAYVKYTVNVSGSSGYYGSLYISGTSVGRSWKNSVSGGSGSGSKSYTVFCPGYFAPRTHECRLNYQDWDGQSGNPKIYSNATTGSVAAMDIPVYFNANGGSVDIESKNITYGDAYGEMPIPNRAGYKFLGWFTERDGGTEIIDETVLTFTEQTIFTSQILYAHWKLQTVFHLIQNGSETLAPLCYIKKDSEVKQAVGLYVVENGQAKQCI